MLLLMRLLSLSLSLCLRLCVLLLLLLLLLQSELLRHERSLGMLGLRKILVSKEMWYGFEGNVPAADLTAVAAGSAVG